MRLRVEFDAREGGTRMTLTGTYASLDDMEKVLAMGMEEGMRGALGQIDAVLGA